MNYKKKELNINLVLGSDQRYFDGLYATLTSLFLHTNTTKHLEIYIFDGGINTISKHLLKKELKKLNTNFSLTYLEPDLNQFKSFLPMGTNYMSYTRLLIPTLIPEKKAIWLDVDLLVLRDIESLWKIDLADKVMGASIDTSVSNIGVDIDNYKQFKIPTTANYFNTGVLLLNNEALLEMNFMEKCFQFLETNIGHYRWYDQSAINVVCFNKIKVLEGSFNTLSVALNTIKKEIVQLNQAGYIYHFILSPKPFIRYSNTVHAQWVKALLHSSNYEFKTLNTWSNRLVKFKHKYLMLYKIYNAIMCLFSKKSTAQKRSLHNHINEIETENKALKTHKKEIHMILNQLKIKFKDKLNVTAKAARDL